MKLGMLDVAKMTVMDIHAQMSMEMVEEGRKAVQTALAVMGNKVGQVN
jgi:ribosomal protein S5